MKGKIEIYLVGTVCMLAYLCFRFVSFSLNNPHLMGREIALAMPMEFFLTMFYMVAFIVLFRLWMDKR